MNAATKTRLLKLEANARSKSEGVRVISGHSRAECEEQRATMVKRGEAGLADLFVFIRRFEEGA